LLLLDDPLQHNDLVHKTAFLDVLRSLVKHERYQVAMSIHDLDEARFFGRKCRNVGVASRLCRLLAPGDTGVQFELV
jgi:exonuclease SbcC